MREHVQPARVAASLDRSSIDGEQIARPSAVQG
jgi:hypothetical protein